MKFAGVIFGFHFMGNSEVIWNYGILHLLHDVMQCLTAGFIKKHIFRQAVHKKLITSWWWKWGNSAGTATFRTVTAFSREYRRKKHALPEEKHDI